MDVEIRRVREGDAAALATIQTESWRAAFRDNLNADTLARLTEFSRTRPCTGGCCAKKRGTAIC